jgi:glycine/D-amino acid oxidase-like deaminating enzyme
MRIAVLGGGLLGCCVALFVARRGAQVTLFDRNDAVLRGAALNNEGKIHLGYVYAGDSSMATARRMIAGALSFRPILDEFLDCEDAFNISTPFTYVVHRDSQRSVDSILGFLAAVHDGIVVASGQRGADYLGAELFPPRTYSRQELEEAFDTAHVKAAIHTPELAVDPIVLCDMLSERVAADPRIELRLGQTVAAVADRGGGFSIQTEPACPAEMFDHVVNALWDGRLAVDAGRGHVPQRPWLYRVKYGVRFRSPTVTQSTTIVLGPFGDTVAYGDGTRYLSWYPSGMRGISSDLSPPTPVLSCGDRRSIIEESFGALGSIMPGLRQITPAERATAELCGGVIIAWGRTDIDDPTSELHCRYDIGVTSRGGYHSVDPGKLSTAPYFARLCADRIMGHPTT